MIRFTDEEIAKYGLRNCIGEPMKLDNLEGLWYDEAKVIPELFARIQRLAEVVDWIHAQFLSHEHVEPAPAGSTLRRVK